VCFPVPPYVSLDLVEISNRRTFFTSGVGEAVWRLHSMLFDVCRLMLKFYENFKKDVEASFVLSGIFSTEKGESHAIKLVKAAELSG